MTKTKKKIDKDTRIAVIGNSKAEVQNSINLNLNNNDIVELMIEENREILIEKYKVLYETLYLIANGTKRLFSLSQSSYYPKAVKTTLVHTASTDKIFSTLIKHFAGTSLEVSIGTGSLDYQRQGCIIVDFNKEQHNTHTIQLPTLLDVNKTCFVIGKLIDSKISVYKVEMGIELSIKEVQTINQMTLDANKDLLDVIKQSEELLKQIKAYNNKSKIKAKFTRSILEKSAEGQEILTRLSLLSATKLLGA